MSITMVVVVISCRAQNPLRVNDYHTVAKVIIIQPDALINFKFGYDCCFPHIFQFIGK